ncbi:MAG: UMP kinase [Firmicutes bacterium]|jgi:uridylate kinase|nr:UMP kinase [Bacillota bacterium]MEE3382614.1 UMP kinase [Anaerovoracaceae bacterium]MBQ1431146.1 UMP kinase [Bacillota bacterium]MBQ1630722.1 UMP kinase [Bacillota bacterium]MBQ1689965.1 UMP kinase [Bacillota bacterium]
MVPKYRRVLLKISGEVLAGEKGSGIDPDVTRNVCEQIKEVHDMGVQVAVVVGGGNFWRGRSSGDMDRATADYMGMLATVMNTMALQDTMRSIGAPCRAMTALEIREVAEPYARLRALSHLENGDIVIFGGGTGSPFFTTDTAAALRASEIGADVILLAKNVDAVYDSDPDENPDAKKFDRLSHMDLVEKNLKVMDLTAATLCSDNHIKIHVFALAEGGNIKRAVLGEKIGTIIE